MAQFQEETREKLSEGAEPVSAGFRPDPQPQHSCPPPGSPPVRREAGRGFLRGTRGTGQAPCAVPESVPAGPAHAWGCLQPSLPHCKRK